MNSLEPSRSASEPELGVILNYVWPVPWGKRSRRTCGCLHRPDAPGLDSETWESQMPSSRCPCLSFCHSLRGSASPPSSYRSTPRLHHAIRPHRRIPKRQRRAVIPAQGNALSQIRKGFPTRTLDGSEHLRQPDAPGLDSENWESQMPRSRCPSHFQQAANPQMTICLSKRVHPRICQALVPLNIL